MNNGIFKTKHFLKFDLQNRFCSVDDVIGITFYHPKGIEKQHCIVTEYCEDYIEVLCRGLNKKGEGTYSANIIIKPEDISNREISLERNRETFNKSNCLKFLISKEIQVLDEAKLCIGDIIRCKTADGKIMFNGVIKNMWLDNSIIMIDRSSPNTIIYDMIFLDDIYNKGHIELLSKQINKYSNRAF